MSQILDDLSQNLDDTVLSLDDTVLSLDDTVLSLDDSIILFDESPLLAIYPPIADNTYQFYKFYQVKKGQVPSTQSNMPLVIIDTLGSGILQQASGFDIRVFDSDGNSLPYDVESVNVTTGEITVHVNVETVKDGEFVQLTFGKPTATDEQNPGVVWSDSNAEYHMNQTTFGASSTIDSTSNNLNGTPQNMDISNQVAGQIDGSLDFNGSTEFVLVSDNPLLEPGTGAFSVSVWITPTNDVRDMICAKVRPTSPFDGWFFAMSNSGNDRKLFVQMRDNGIFTVRGTQQLTLDTPHLVAFTYDGSGDASGVRIFIDGVEDTTNIELDTLDDNGVTNEIEFNIGNLGGTNPNLSWEGNIDELNISAVVKTPDFIKTQFNNQSDNDAFWFKTPLLENGEDNFLVDDQGRNIVAVQT